jgi:hypothetical protein
MRITDYIPEDCPIPPLYGTEDTALDTKIVWVKLVAPAVFTFYLVEFSPAAEDGYPNLAFGYVHNADEPYFSEWGYISLEELDDIRVAGFPPVKRDLDWIPKPFGEIELPR